MESITLYLAILCPFFIEIFLLCYSMKIIIKLQHFLTGLEIVKIFCIVYTAAYKVNMIVTALFAVGL